jgi:hypothetical protein
VSPSRQNAFKNDIEVNVGAPYRNNGTFLEIGAKPGDLPKAREIVGQVLNIFLYWCHKHGGVVQAFYKALLCMDLVGRRKKRS